MQGEMTTPSTCLLSTVSLDDTTALTAATTHEMYTMYVCQHCYTVVHVEYPHTRERHALYGEIGQYCSLPTMLVVLQREIQVGEMRYTTQNACGYTVHIC